MLLSLSFLPAMDSPLSITASVTGIATLVAAVLAFVYVRDTTLTNSNEEIANILTSVGTSLEDARLTRNSTRRRDEAAGDPQPIDNGITHLEKLLRDISALEMDILRLLIGVYGSDPPDTISRNEFAAAVPETQPGAEWKNALKELRATEKMYRQGKTLSFLVTGRMLVVSTFGVSKPMTRWYRVRKEVQQKVQEREALRSRLLYHELSMINLYASFLS